MEIELQTFLSSDERNSIAYIAHMNMIGSMCMSNINIVNRYSDILKPISSYCVNSTFPFLTDKKCKSKTIDALALAFESMNIRTIDKVKVVFSSSDMNYKDKTERNKNDKAEQNEYQNNLRVYNDREHESLVDALKSLINLFTNEVKEYLTRAQKK